VAEGKLPGYWESIGKKKRRKVNLKGIKAVSQLGKRIMGPGGR